MGDQGAIFCNVALLMTWNWKSGGVSPLKQIKKKCPQRTLFNGYTKTKCGSNTRKERPQMYHSPEEETSTLYLAIQMTKDNPKNFESWKGQ